MADVPLPDVPCIRVKLDYTYTGVGVAGSRFYLSYTGSAPTGPNLNTLASDISGAWGTHYASLVQEDYDLAEVDCLDIATDSGLSGFFTTPVDGSRAGTPTPAQTTMNIEYNIARRYRGGKPRIYMPPGVYSDTNDLSHWTPEYQGDCGTGFAAFIAEIAALSIGAIGTLAHVNLSYYKGYQNVEIPGKRAYSSPTYRATALHDNVTGYAPKLLMGSQRRRRTATTF